jgi:hypothetical protein
MEFTFQWEHKKGTERYKERITSIPYANNMIYLFVSCTTLHTKSDIIAKLR